VIAIGPGHNIPLLGGTPVVAKELVILTVVGVVASIVLVEGEAIGRWRRAVAEQREMAAPGTRP